MDRIGSGQTPQEWVGQRLAQMAREPGHIQQAQEAAMRFARAYDAGEAERALQDLIGRVGVPDVPAERSDGADVLAAGLSEAIERVRADAVAAREEAEQARAAVEGLHAELAERAQPAAAPAPAGRAQPAAAPEPAAPSEEPRAASVAEAPRSGPAHQPRGAVAGDDPLAAALADLAAELEAAAGARRRGELDAPEAIRLLRAGFHKARRVLGSVQRRELRRQRRTPERSGRV